MRQLFFFKFSWEGTACTTLEGISKNDMPAESNTVTQLAETIAKHGRGTMD